MSAFQAQNSAGFINPGEPEFRIDFLTPMVRNNARVVRIPALAVDLQPLKFMEFSLEDISQAVVLSEEGAVMVNIPSPARFTVHKLLVYGERSGEFRLKAVKDLAQAAALIEYLAAIRPDELRQAWEDALSRGKGWKKRAIEGLKALKILKPEVVGIDILESNP